MLRNLCTLGGQGEGEESQYRPAAVCYLDGCNRAEAGMVAVGWMARTAGVCSVFKRAPNVIEMTTSFCVPPPTSSLPSIRSPPSAMCAAQELGCRLHVRRGLDQEGRRRRRRRPPPPPRRPRGQCPHLQGRPLPDLRPGQHPPSSGHRLSRAIYALLRARGR